LTFAAGSLFGALSAFVFSATVISHGSLWEGPDTGSALETFETMLECSPPDSVHGVFFGDRYGTTVFGRFCCSDPTFVEAVAASKSLDPDAAVRTLPEHGPDWLPWPPDESRDADVSWSRDEGREVLWYFRGSGVTVYRWVIDGG
jgi:hypothetical protein